MWSIVIVDIPRENDKPPTNLTLVFLFNFNVDAQSNWFKSAPIIDLEIYAKINGKE